MSSLAPAANARSIYRSLLRETNKLPYGYLRAFFRFKFRDDVTSAARSSTHFGNHLNVKQKRLRRDLRKLRAANEGDKMAFSRLLDLAYGRVGKLKRELAEPFLHSITKTPPIIPGVEKSWLPVYSRELTALLTSSVARSVKKSLKHSSLKNPPSLPPQADPQSEEARLFGPLSKRREVNIHWRFFTEETRKMFPPLDISVVNLRREADGIITAATDPDQTKAVQKLGLVEGGFQDLGLSRALINMTGTHSHPPKTRRERKAIQSHPVLDNQTQQADDRNTAPALPTRTLRRSHQHLLEKVPLLTYTQKILDQDRDRDSHKGSYDVSLSKHATSMRQFRTPTRLTLIDENNLAWIRRAEEVDKQKESTKK